METVLITGGTGLIGLHLTGLLLNEGFNVCHLSRKRKPSSKIETFVWKPDEKFIDERALTKADHIIHLAGESVAAYWTPAYKRKLIDSRVKSALLIFELLGKRENKVKSFISASAVGYYEDGGNRWLHESDQAGADFLSKICMEWEHAAENFKSLNKRVAVIRTGIVIAKEGGTLPALLNPMKLGIAPIFGNGMQYYPWIHIDDLCRMYLHFLTHENPAGTYNGVAPEPVPFKELVHAITQAKGNKKLQMKVPSLFLKFFLDGFGDSLLKSLRCSSEKITAAGFQFTFPELLPALKEILRQ